MGGTPSKASIMPVHSLTWWKIQKLWTVRRFVNQYCNRNTKNITDSVVDIRERPLILESWTYLRLVDISKKVKAYQITCLLLPLRGKNWLGSIIRNLHKFPLPQCHCQFTSQIDLWTLKAHPCNDKAKLHLEIKTQKDGYQPVPALVLKIPLEGQLCESHRMSARNKRSKVSCQIIWLCSIINISIFRIPRFSAVRRNTKIMRRTTWRYRNLLTVYNTTSWGPRPLPKWMWILMRNQYHRMLFKADLIPTHSHMKSNNLDTASII